MRGGGSSCKGLEAKSTDEAVLQDTSNAEVINVQNIRNKWESSVMRKSINAINTEMPSSTEEVSLLQAQEVLEEMILFCLLSQLISMVCQRGNMLG